MNAKTCGTETTIMDQKIWKFLDLIKKINNMNFFFCWINKLNNINNFNFIIYKNK